MKRTRVLGWLVLALFALSGLTWLATQLGPGAADGGRQLPAVSFGVPSDGDYDSGLALQAPVPDAAPSDASALADDSVALPDGPDSRRVLEKTNKRSHTATTSGRRVIAQVRDEAGDPIEGALLRLAQIPWDGTAPDIENAFSAQTNRKGIAEVLAAPPGRYCAVLVAAGFATTEHYGCTVGAGDKFDLGSFTLQRGIVVRGRVTNTFGEPVEGAFLVADIKGPWLPVAAEDILATTDRLGEFVIDTLPFGPWSLRVDSTLYPSAELDGRVTDSEDMDESFEIVLPEAGEYHGRVTGHPDHGLIGLVAVAERFDTRGKVLPGTRIAEVAPDGRFRLIGLALDRGYRVRVHTAGDARSQRVIPRYGRPSLEETQFPWVPASSLKATIRLDGKSGTAHDVFVQLRYGCEDLLHFSDGPQDFFGGSLNWTELHGYG